MCKTCNKGGKTMYAIKRKGNGQTICVGCLAKDKYAVNWDSMLMELYYDSGTFLGNFCSECMAVIKKALYSRGEKKWN